MGNSESCMYIDDKLMDSDVEIRIPSSLAKVESELILAPIQGQFFPCVILHESDKIPKGYCVYFFHLRAEVDVPAKNVIGNLKALIHREISYYQDNGKSCTGYVRATDASGPNAAQPMNFLICKGVNGVWVSLPYIFLNKEQAKLFMY